MNSSYLCILNITDSDLIQLLEDIRYIVQNSNEKIVITPQIVKNAIRRLNSNKAPDINGMVAEHLKVLVNEPDITNMLC